MPSKCELPKWGIRLVYAEVIKEREGVVNTWMHIGITQGPQGSTDAWVSAPGICITLHMVWKVFKSYLRDSNWEPLFYPIVTVAQW